MSFLFLSKSRAVPSVNVGLDTPGNLNLMQKTPTMPQKNLSILGRGFNILTLDPLDISSSALMKSAIDFGDFANYKLIADASMALPEGVDYQPCSGGNSVDSTVIIKSFAEFKQKVGVSVQRSGSGSLSNLFKAASFKESLSYQRYVEYNEESETVTTLSKMKVRNDAISIDLSRLSDLTHVSLSKEIVKWSNDLKNNFDPSNPSIEQLYFDFIEQHGTHISNKVEFGGLAFLQSYITKKQYDYLIKEKVNIKIEAEGSFKLVKAGVKFDVNSDKSKKYGEVTDVSRKFIEYRGGIPHEDLYQWAGSVNDEPTAIDIEITPLYTLLTTKNDHGINVSAEVEKAVRSYLQKAIVTTPAQKQEISCIFTWPKGKKDYDLKLITYIINGNDIFEIDTSKLPEIYYDPANPKNLKDIFGSSTIGGAVPLEFIDRVDAAGVFYSTKQGDNDYTTYWGVISGSNIYLASIGLEVPKPPPGIKPKPEYPWYSTNSTPHLLPPTIRSVKEYGFYPLSKVFTHASDPVAYQKIDTLGMYKRGSSDEIGGLLFLGGKEKYVEVDNINDSSVPPLFYVSAEHDNSKKFESLKVFGREPISINGLYIPRPLDQQQFTYLFCGQYLLSDDSENKRNAFGFPKRISPA